MTRHARVDTPSPQVGSDGGNRPPSETSSRRTRKPSATRVRRWFRRGGRSNTVLDDPPWPRSKRCHSWRPITRTRSKALEAALASNLPRGDDAVRWRYQLGDFARSPGILIGAADAFDEAATERRPLAPLRAFRRCAGAPSRGHVEERSRARAVADGVPRSRQGATARGRSAGSKSTIRAPRSRFGRRTSRESRHPPRWIEVVLRMADAMLEDAPTLGPGRKAALLRAASMVEAPTSSAVQPRARFRAPRARVGPRVAADSSGRRAGQGGTYSADRLGAGAFARRSATRATALADRRNTRTPKKRSTPWRRRWGRGPPTSEVGCRAQVLARFGSRQSCEIARSR